jgi:hypothetical protein
MKLSPPLFFVEILATLLNLKPIPSCMSADDVEQLLQDIAVQPPVVVPVRTVQEAVAAGDLPPLDVNVFSQSEYIVQEHVRKHGIKAAELQDLILRVLHHRVFNAADVDHDLHDAARAPDESRRGYRSHLT